MIAEGVADCVYRRKHEELIVGHLQTELLIEVVIVLGSLIASAASAVKVTTCVDTRGRWITVVLARNRVASAAHGGWVVVLVSVGDGGREYQSRGRGEEEGGSCHSSLHDQLIMLELLNME
jgi:hypothetical protein